MLAIAGLRVDTEETSEGKKGGLVVREIRADHTLGEVHALLVPEGVTRHPQGFEFSEDKGFVAACGELLADRVFLEQQDLGKLLGRRAMKWHDPAAWPAGSVPGDSDKWVAGKAYSFFRRDSGEVVGISKMGFVTVSGDSGETWSMPVVPPTLVTGKAKVWSQRTADGRYALVYNPSTRTRFPLVLVSGDDGVHFGKMRVVQGELPVQRYAGLHRSIGPQYVRGISSWADDGSRKEDEGAMWVTYSMSKEDIWVSRVPLPAGKESADWGVYSPKWAAVTVDGDELRLSDRDPFDYGRAVRVFGARSAVNVRFSVCSERVNGGVLEVELFSTWGSRRPVRLRLEDGRVMVMNGEKSVEIGKYTAKEWLALTLKADVGTNSFTVEFQGKPVLRPAAFAEAAEDVQRISFRTGEYRGIGGAKPVAVETDRPTEAVEFRIRNLVVEE